MRAHPTEERLLDLALGDGSPEARGHLTECAACAARVEEARTVAEFATEVDVPEPPEPFWAEFRRDLRRRIAEEERPPAAWRRWLLPLAAVPVALVVAVVVYRPPSGREAPQARSVASAVPERPLPAWTALPPAEEDADLPVLEGLAASGVVDWDEGRGLGAYLAGLSDEDSALLATALGRSGVALRQNQEGAL